MHSIWSFFLADAATISLGLTEDRATVGTDPSAAQVPRRMRGFTFEAPFLFPCHPAWP